MNCSQLHNLTTLLHGLLALTIEKRVKEMLKMVSVDGDGDPRQGEIPAAKNDEIGTLPPSSTSPTTATAPSVTTKGEQLHSQRDQSDSHKEIEYLYLTFNTQLPSPTDISLVQPNQSPPPEAPDLRPYVSPFLWPSTRKAVITALSCTVTLMSASCAGSYAPAQNQLTAAWNIGPIVFNLGITSYTTGFAIAPMISAPFSEINGRRPIIIGSGILFMGNSLLFPPFLSYFIPSSSIFGRRSLELIGISICRCSRPDMLWSNPIICGNDSCALLGWGCRL